MVDGWYSMIKVLLLGLVLIAGTQQPKTEQILKTFKENNNNLYNVNKMVNKE